ncbi:hypothetical protein OSB04_000304 [Centaurea solstitialis]|uniref:Uncharacterized protein n=1 Tax=Centaurea solstitialis TaxID=347529 RepID=A0AA38U894_9ASTR|nr:hypothetical protein OSB04_000304 [Centaurea solstitialis]
MWRYPDHESAFGSVHGRQGLVEWLYGSRISQRLHIETWEKTIAPKNLGGLGIGSLKAANIALLLKWWWRIMNEDSALWVKVIQSIQGISGRDSKSILSSKKPGVWLNIVRNGAALQRFNLNIEDFFTREVGKGDKTKFWTDRWLGSTPLCSMFPDLYELDNDKSCSIASRCTLGAGGFYTWNWSRINTTETDGLQEKLEELQSLPRKKKIDGVGKEIRVVIWSWFFKWCGLNLSQLLSLEHLLFAVSDLGTDKNRKMFLEAAVGGVLWHIWKAQNNTVFNSKLFTAPMVMDEVQASLFCG